MKWFITAFKVGVGFHLGKMLVCLIPEIPRIWRTTIIKYSESDTAPQEIKNYATKLMAKEKRPQRPKDVKIVGFTA